MSLQDLQNGTHEDFLEQVLCSLQSGVSWPELSTVTGNGGGGGGGCGGVDIFDDQSAFLTNKLRQHQISGDLGFYQNDIVDATSFKSMNGNNSVQALFNGFTGSLKYQTQNFQYPPPAQNFGSPGPTIAPVTHGPTTVATAVGGGGGPPAQPRQRVRARRGQATDPHSIAERLRRERIAERMKSLQELAGPAPRI